MINLRKEARGRDCQVRTPVCSFNPDTTILAHLNGAGMGRKHPDLLGAHCCAECHTWLDGGYAQFSTRDNRDLYHMRGIIRTIQVLIDEGKVNF